MEANTPIPDPEGCGIGQGAACCAYITMGPAGFTCEQETLLGQTLARRAVAGTMTAQALPHTRYPQCQIDRADPS